MDMTVILATRDQCTGCGACYKICPKGVISFVADDEGFPSPIINDEKCIHCGLCEKTCPARHLPETQTIQVAYAAQLRDKDTLKDSTSGGAFTAFAKEIFRLGGVVYGCVWDENYNAIIKKAENEEEIKPMRGSKYVWSWAGDAYSEIKSYLDKGKTVLFTGLPCQVAGLKNYLRRDYEHLFLVDFFCGGCSSPYAFREHLKSITGIISLDKLDLKFRDKEKYGVGVHVSYNTPKGRVQQSYIRNPYYFSYYTKVFHRLPCYHCQYRYEHRVEDITMGDYWGVAQYHTGFDIRAGVSAILVNSKKGMALLDAVRDELFLCETNVQNIAKGNNLSLGDIRKEYNVPSFRNAIFVELQKNGWDSAERKFLFNKTRLKLWLKTKNPEKHIMIIKKCTGR